MHHKPEAPSSTPVCLEVPTAHRVRESSGVVVARLAERMMALVADADDHAIRAFDATTLEPLGRTELDGAPRDLLVSVAGRVYVTMPERSEILTLGATTSDGMLQEISRTKTDVEPIAMALPPAEDRILVVTGASHRIQSFALPTVAHMWTVDLAREPRAVLVTNDGKRAFVGHAIAGDASIVSLDDRAPPTVERADLDLGGHLVLVNDRLLPRTARHATSIVRVRVRDGDEGKDVDLLAFPLVQQAPWGGAPAGYGHDDTPITTPAPPQLYGCGPYVPGTFAGDGRSTFDVRLVGPKSGVVRHRAADRNVSHACLLPRAAIGIGDRVLVACEGGSDLVRVQFDRAGWPHQDGAIRVGRGPSAIARIPGAARAIVWGEIGRSLSLVSLEENASEALAVRDVERARERDGKVLAGREIFRRTGDDKISNDGIACASCHPDGRDDDLVWTGPHGKRRPPTLAGNVARRGSFGWGGEHPTLESHMTQTVSRLGGKGLSDDELASLAAYLRSLSPAPAVDSHALDRDLLATRGKTIFESDRAACATCHGPKDRDVHDVGSGGAFVTPALTGVGARRTLFHDGRFDSLDQLLARSPRMGGAAQLAPDERAALVAYLRTL